MVNDTTDVQSKLDDSKLEIKKRFPFPYIFKKTMKFFIGLDRQPRIDDKVLFLLSSRFSGNIKTIIISISIAMVFGFITHIYFAEIPYYFEVLIAYCISSPIILSTILEMELRQDIKSFGYSDDYEIEEELRILKKKKNDVGFQVAFFTLSFLAFYWGILGFNYIIKFFLYLLFFKWMGFSIVLSIIVVLSSFEIIYLLQRKIHKASFKQYLLKSINNEL